MLRGVLILVRFGVVSEYVRSAYKYFLLKRAPPDAVIARFAIDLLADHKVSPGRFLRPDDKYL